MTHIKEEWEDNHSLKLKYNQTIRHKNAIFILLLAIATITALMAIKIGSYQLSTVDILKSLTGLGNETSDIVTWNLRIPRISASIISGIALALSGLIIQTLLTNPLASPSTLGVSQGAAFGASFAIIILGASYYLTTFCAFLGSLTVVVVVWLLQKFQKMSPGTVILAGVAISSLFVSSTIMVQYFADEVEIASALFWTFGDISRSSWNEQLILAIVTFLSLFFFFIKAKSLNALSQGDETALTLGIEVKRLRLTGLIVASLLAALTTCFHGVIAFLGLLAPHIARKLIGNNHVHLIPCSALIGIILLLLSDILGKVIVQGGTFPVGVITSFLGAPLFLYLLIIGKRQC